MSKIKNSLFDDIDLPKKSLFDDVENPSHYGKRKSQSKLACKYSGISSCKDDISILQKYLGEGKSKPSEGKNIVSTITRESFCSDKKRKSEKLIDLPVSHRIPFPVEVYQRSVINPIDTVPVMPDVNTDRSLVLADDFIKHESTAVVGETLYIYNGRFYELLSAKEAERLIFRYYRKQVGSVRNIKDTVDFLKLNADKVLNEFPENTNFVIFDNGTLDIKKGVFRTNAPEDMSNSALGISYDPKVRDMPHTRRFLQTICNGDDELYERILQVTGYILSNDMRAKSFFYLQGVPNSGKSRFCDLVASFFPDIGANKVGRIALQDFDGRFALGNLVNCKLNISEDLPDTPLSAKTISKIKMISDANRLECEMKYMNAFSFKPLCKLLFASNHPLRIKERDEAFLNRVVYIPFDYTISKEKQDKDILQKMKPELSALFNHAFEAYVRLVKNNYVWAGNYNPDIVVVNSGISFDKTQILQWFFETCCISAEGAVVATDDLKKAYLDYCHKNNYQPIVGDRFSREFSALYPNLERIKIANQKRGYRGIKLRENYVL